MENYLLNQPTKLHRKIEKTETNRIYELMKERPKHKVRNKESEFKATDVPMIQVGLLNKKYLKNEKEN